MKTKLTFVIHCDHSELRMEIDLFPMRSPRLPTSANFPSPPNDDAQTPEEFPVQESWYYYLSEISQKHTVDRIIDTFYAVGDDTELLRLPLSPKIQIASELEQHELLAASTLPDWLRFRGEADDREIPWVLHSRALFVRGMLFQPFLFLAIHSTAPLPLVVHDYTQRCLQACYDLIYLFDIQHRHHGSWLIARGTFRCSLCIIAASRSGSIVMRQDWRHCIEMAIGIVDFWGKEAIDLERLARLLRSIYEEADDSSQV